MLWRPEVQSAAQADIEKPELVQSLYPDLVHSML